MIQRALMHVTQEKLSRSPTMQPKVWNKHHKNAPADAVYIGRGSPWGNPFSHMANTKAQYIVETREQAIKLFEMALGETDKAIIRRELKGKHLLCFCAPKPCHGDVLLRIANEEKVQ